MAKTKTEASEYGAGQIKVLKGLEAVRKRPGMFIGSTDTRGLHHLIWEVVDNSIDEAMAGHCSEIAVTLHADGSLSVHDDGRGIPVDVHPEEGKPGVELALTVLHAGGKFDKDSYKVSGGLHGVGVSCVNALSEWMVVTVCRAGKKHIIELERGDVVRPLRVAGKGRVTGTTVCFKPDPQIFEVLDFDWGTVARHLRQSAFLNPGLRILLTDERGAEPRQEIYHSKRGLAEMVELLSRGKGALHNPLTLSGDLDDVHVDVALQYNGGYNEEFLSFVNNIRTPEGGTHETGFRAALTHAVLAYQAEHGTAQQKKTKLQGSDLKEGLIAVVAVRVAEPQFEGQVKGRLGNSEVRGIVQSLAGEALRQALDENPKAAKAILEKSLSAARSREAARKARDVARGQKSLLEAGVLAGKLADCSSNNPQRNELFIVEGDSAGGTAKMGRDRLFQAILPLKGKILNTERARLDRILDNDEVRALITAMGCGFGGDFDINRLRYHKLIILTDADVDGAHIRALLLTLLFRHFLPLIEHGHVYVAQPPLYQMSRGRKSIYAYTEAEKEKLLASEFGGDRGTVSLQRYKGLGEMGADQLWGTTMEPARRALLRVQIDDVIEADRIFTTLMGDEVPPRRDWIFQHAKFASVDL